MPIRRYLRARTQSNGPENHADAESAIPSQYQDQWDELLDSSANVDFEDFTHQISSNTSEDQETTSGSSEDFVLITQRESEESSSSLKSILKTSTEESGPSEQKEVTFTTPEAYEQIMNELRNAHIGNNFHIDSDSISYLLSGCWVFEECEQEHFYSPKIIARFGYEQNNLCPLCESPHMVDADFYLDHLYNFHGIDEKFTDKDLLPIHVIGDQQRLESGEVRTFQAFVCPRDRCNYKKIIHEGCDEKLDYDEFFKHAISKHPNDKERRKINKRRRILTKKRNLRLEFEQSTVDWIDSILETDVE